MSTQHLIQLLEDDNQKELYEIYIKNGWKNNIDFEMVYDIIFNLKNPSIHNMIGYMYRYGRHVEQDYEKAFHYFKLSADQGNQCAQDNLGNMYYYGRHVEQDYEKAFYYFKLSADQGNKCAQNDLGAMYHRGYYVEQDYKTAFYYFKLSADQGNDIAKDNIKYVIKAWDNIDEYIAELINDVNILKEKNRTLEEENTELRYQPGNIGYREAKEHWMSCVNN